MSINPFTKATPTTLQDSLAAKAGELRLQQEADTASAKYFAQAAVDAGESAKVAARKAGAVEEALSILIEADVTI